MKDDFEPLEETARLPLGAYAAMLWRRRWYIALPTVLLGLAGFGAARYWHYLYRSEALVLVEQQKIPENYVSSNVAISLDERVDQMTQQILSRTQLRRLVEQFNLYRRDLAHKSMDDVIDRMRSSIKVELVTGDGKSSVLTAFRIRFQYSEPRMAQRVTNELTSLFIDENMAARTEQSAGATKFFETELESARQDLAAQEARLRAYKMSYIGELPEQLNSNLQMLEAVQNQLRATRTAIDRAEQEKVYLETLRTEYRTQQKMVAETGQSPTGRTPAQEAAAERTKALQDLRQKLANIKTIYTPEYPDVRKLEAQIAALEAAPITTGSTPVPGTAALVTPAPLSQANEGAILETEGRLKALNVEIANDHRESADLLKQSEQIQKRLGRTPVREQELAEVNRNYENSRANYQSLLQKKRQSELASDLEKRQQGERLRVLDSASLPKKPDVPTRKDVMLAGWVAGLCLGLALALLREFTDRRVRNVDDLARLAKLPNLSCFPIILSRREQSARYWKGGLEITCAILLAAVSVGSGIEAYWKP
ncbi:MAG TPA: GNVR domain-containing protein [Bryobacteraceae bacterium]|nr:GNVR domain-containing protein [Bryobacteraceae bacterium]